MPDTKITALTAIGANPIIPATFPIPMVDLTDTSMAASGTTKKVTVNQILGAGGTATLASATITGDLTVDTNVLKVDTTNNRVGIGTASPTSGIKLDIVSTTSDNFVRFTDSVNATGYLGVQASNGTVYLHGNNNKVSLSCSTSNTTATEQLRITNPGVFEFLDGAGGTRMTLNSTGLGVGGSPLDKFTVVGNSFLRGAAAGVRIGDGGGYGFISAYDQTLSTAKDLVLQTGGGNVGIGVTPSAWDSGFQVIENSGGSLWSGSTGAVRFSQNAYYATSLKYKNALAASQYVQTSGQHQWFYDSGTRVVGQPVNFVQAMTLDASGNLLVGTTSGSFGSRLILSTDTGTTKWATGPFPGGPTNYYITANNTQGVFLNGTTATAWTAISDERLKDIIEPISNAVAKVGLLRSVIGKFKTDVEGTRRSFLIAQDVLAAFPEAAVATNPDKLAVTYTEVIPLLVAAIKELAAEVNALKKA